MGAYRAFTPPFPTTRAHAGYWRVKRVMDIIVSACLLLLLSPLLLLIACAIKVYSPGPMLFVQERVGYDRETGRIRRFKLYKFRSMRVNADPDVHLQHVRNLIRNQCQRRQARQPRKRWSGTAASPALVDSCAAPASTNCRNSSIYSAAT